jgi:hypothetical protein
MLLGLTACGSGGGLGGLGGLLGGRSTCNPGTQVQLARPGSGQSGVNGNLGSIEIVANGSSDALHYSPNQWTLQLVDTFNNQTITTGQLSPASDTSGPHPFTQDFYYSGSLQQQLPQGTTWSVRLVNSSTYCTPDAFDSFST